MKRLFLLLIVILGIVISSCKKEELSPGDTEAYLCTSFILHNESTDTILVQIAHKGDTTIAEVPYQTGYDYYKWEKCDTKTWDEWKEYSQTEGCQQSYHSYCIHLYYRIYQNNSWSNWKYEYETDSQGGTNITVY